MPKLQAACTLTAGDGMKVHTRSAERRRGPGGGARVHPAQPPARLPGLRQGRRVPAAGPDVPLRARQHALPPQQAHVREAARDLAPDRARSRALHPLLPLHALLAGRRPGRAAGRARARRRLHDRDVRGRALPRALLGQRDRAVPGRRADLDRLPLQGAALGDQRHPERVRAVPGRLQHLGRRCARATCSACSRATTPRSTRAGCATAGRFAHGHLRGRRPLPARPRARPARARARERRAARRDDRAAPAPPRQPARPRLDRRRGLGRAEQRGGARLGRARARRRRRRARQQRASATAIDWDALAPYAATHRRPRRAPT